MGRNKKYQTEEERLEAKRKREAEYYQANKLKRSLYYKERYKKLKEENEESASVTPPPTATKKVTVYGNPSDVEDVWVDPIEDDSASHYTGPIT